MSPSSNSSSSFRSSSFSCGSSSAILRYLHLGVTIVGGARWRWNKTVDLGDRTGYADCFVTSVVEMTVAWLATQTLERKKLDTPTQDELRLGVLGSPATAIYTTIRQVVLGTP